MTPSESRQRAVEALQAIATYARAVTSIDPSLPTERSLRAMIEDMAAFADRVAKETGSNGS